MVLNVLMVLSGISMVIFDSRIVQRYFRRIRDRFRRRDEEPQVELGDGALPSPVREAQRLLPIDSDGHEVSASGINAQDASLASSKVET